MLGMGHPAFAILKTSTPNTMKSLLTLALISSSLLLSNCSNGCIFAKKKPASACTSCTAPATKSASACCASHTAAKKTAKP